MNINKPRNASITSLSSLLNRRKPPLPPSSISAKRTSEGISCSDATKSGPKRSEEKSPLATRQNTTLKPNLRMAKPLMESFESSRLDQDKESFLIRPPEPYPRRRLASFGGLGSSDQHRAKLGVPDLPSLVKTHAKSCENSLQVHSTNPSNLQLVRDQMSVALERLKDLEERVKIIPVLQVKISVLQEEKRQLVAMVMNHENQKELQNTKQVELQSSGTADDKKRRRESSEKMDDWQHGASLRLAEIKQLSVEMQLLEKEIEDACLRTQWMPNLTTKDTSLLNIGGDVKSSKSVLELRSVAVGVSEPMLGVVSKTEFELQQQIDPRPRGSSDKNSVAQPEMNSIGTQVTTSKRTVGVGNHVQMVHSSVGEGQVRAFNHAGVICTPETKEVSSGPDTATNICEVEKKDQCVGRDDVSTCDQSIWVAVSVRDVGVVTSEMMETMETRSVGCGDCTIGNVNMVKPLVSKSLVTEHGKGYDSRTVFTGTSQSFSQDKCTSTVHTTTRTLAVGDGKITSHQSTTQMRSTGVGTPVSFEGSPIQGIPKVLTRDVGVGYANIHDNYLVGLRTRNMACGPSCLPDPIKTRSIGVEVGDGRVRDADGCMWTPVRLLQPEVYRQSESGPDHSIDRTKTLLQEQESLLTRDSFETRDVTLRTRSLLEKHHSKCDDVSNMNRKDIRDHHRSTECKKIHNSASLGYEMSETIRSACHSLKNHLNNSTILSNRELRSCLNTIQQEWFWVSSLKTSCPDTVEDLLCALRQVSLTVLTHVVNMADRNGNTALHYCISHSNFRVVQKLVDAGVCNVDQQNKAGYTPIMLAALAVVETLEDMSVVEELFKKGDVNAKATQAGQTALMLAVSHGCMDMVKILLTSGSRVNIQDDEGSTALMCASEHGHSDIVRVLLAQPSCDATLTDNDGSTALSIALEAGHKDIAMLLYAHMNYAKSQAVVPPRSRTPTMPAGRRHHD